MRRVVVQCDWPHGRRRRRSGSSKTGGSPEYAHRIARPVAAGNGHYKQCATLPSRRTNPPFPDNRHPPADRQRSHDGGGRAGMASPGRYCRCPKLDGRGRLLLPRAEPSWHVTVRDVRTAVMQPRMGRRMLDIRMIRAIKRVAFVREEAAPADVVAGPEIRHHLVAPGNDFRGGFACEKNALRSVKSIRIDDAASVSIARLI